MKKEKYKWPANVELEYAIGEGTTVMAEMKNVSTSVKKPSPDYYRGTAAAARVATVRQTSSDEVSPVSDRLPHPSLAAPLTVQRGQDYYARGRVRSVSTMPTRTPAP